MQRALSATPAVIDKCFAQLTDVFTRQGLVGESYSEVARRMWNCDETGLCTSVVSKKVICRKGDRVVTKSGVDLKEIMSLF